MFKYSDEKYELLKDENKVFVKDKSNEQYFQIDAKEIEEIHTINWKEYTSKISKKKIFIFLIFFIFLYIWNFSIIFYKTSNNTVSIIKFAILSMLYLSVFIIIHEVGHIYFYKKFGGKITKIGFKLNYIFPSLYVRMNDTYLFSKYEKLLVHGGGLLFSLILNGSLFLIAKTFEINILVNLTKVMFLDIIWNTTPILNSDGYKIILTFFSVNEKKYLKNNSKFVLFFKVINLLVIIIYLIYILKELFF